MPEECFFLKIKEHMTPLCIVCGRETNCSDLFDIPLCKECFNEIELD